MAETTPKVETPTTTVAAAPAAPVAAAAAPVEGEKKQVKKAGKKGKGEEPQFTLKTPKGTKDYDPKQMTVREACIAMIKECFKRHGAVTIDTPVFELRETLMGKYGEDSKLIYDLQDQGGELLSLRYDLTVPFARYMAMNSLKQLRRYHIGKVYRRDNPATTKGRFREFMQCDFDCAGAYDVMVPDSECLAILCDILSEAGVGDFCVKLNHRKLLDAIFAICGVPEALFRGICSAVDKLDKAEWKDVRDEMVRVKSLDPAIADRIHEFVTLRGKPREMAAKLREMCKGDKLADEALAEMDKLFDYTDSFQITDRLVFDMSLVRGLDYYTGLVFEATLVGGSEVGSVAGGGRYDNLIGMFGNEKIPAIGFSVGLERLFTITEGLMAKSGMPVRECETDVYVLSGMKDSLRERMKLTSELWNAGFRAEFLPKASAKLTPQLSQAEKAGVPYAVIIGESELENGTVQIKDLSKREQITVPRAQLSETLRKLLSKPKFAPLDPNEKPIVIGDHSFVRAAFARPTNCACCTRTIFGSGGYCCTKCSTPFHQRCLNASKDITCTPTAPLSTPAPAPATAPSTSQ